MADEKTSSAASNEAPDTDDTTPDELAPDEAAPGEAASGEAAHELSEADQAPDNGDAAHAAGLAGLVPGVADAEPGPDSGGDAAELKEKLLRALAELENLRRRGQREREDATRYAMTNFARDLLTVADNLHRALDSVTGGSPSEPSEPADGLKTLTEGIEMTERELMNLFERYDIHRVEPAGEKFDPNFHQAMFEVPDSGQAPGTVVQVMQPGYVIGERLLRPAMVGVAAAAAGDEEGESSGAGRGSRIDTTV